MTPYRHAQRGSHKATVTSAWLITQSGCVRRHQDSSSRSQTTARQPGEAEHQRKAIDCEPQAAHRQSMQEPGTLTERKAALFKRRAARGNPDWWRAGAPPFQVRLSAAQQSAHQCQRRLPSATPLEPEPDADTADTNLRRDGGQWGENLSVSCGSEPSVLTELRDDCVHTNDERPHHWIDRTSAIRCTHDEGHANPPRPRRSGHKR